MQPRKSGLHRQLWHILPVNTQMLKRCNYNKIITSYNKQQHQNSQVLVNLSLQASCLGGHNDPSISLASWLTAKEIFSKNEYKRFHEIVHVENHIILCVCMHCKGFVFFIVGLGYFPDMLCDNYYTIWLRIKWWFFATIVVISYALTLDKILKIYHIFMISLLIDL